MSKHILVVSQYFYPEEFRINDICKEWIKKGYKVTVLTGIPNYPQGKYFQGYSIFKKRREYYEGIDIIRIPLIPRGRNAMMLSLNYLSFVISGYLWQLFTKVEADYVFIFEVSPMTQALPGVWYSKRKQIPCYLYVQDLWPENVEIITGIRNKRFISIIGLMVDYIYERCTKIFATSNSFVKSIVNRNVPQHKVEYWPQYAEDFYIPLEQVSVPEIPDNIFFNLVFAGNIGEAQGLDILLKTALELERKGVTDIRFNIIGDGRYKEVLISDVKENGLNDMFNFISKQPASRIPKFMAASDVAFLSLTNNPLFEMTIPAKLQSYMACGIPIVAAASGETAQIIRNANSGLTGAPGDAEKLAKNIIILKSMTRNELETLGYNGRKYYEKHFNKEMLLKKMDDYFTIEKEEQHV